MRPLRTLWLLALGICCCSGCALIEDSCHNFAAAISTPVETHRENARNRNWAETAWDQVGSTQVGCQRSEDYAAGFKDGFAEYLFRGGDGEPPLIAPRRYRDIRYQNPQGYMAIQDWFAGYRHGAAMAKESGARKWITAPISLGAELERPVMSVMHEAAPPPKQVIPSDKAAPWPLVKALPDLTQEQTQAATNKIDLTSEKAKPLPASNDNGWPRIRWPQTATVSDAVPEPMPEKLRATILAISVARPIEPNPMPRDLPLAKPPVAPPPATPPPAKLPVAPPLAMPQVAPPPAKLPVTPPQAMPQVAPPPAKIPVTPPQAMPAVTPPPAKIPVTPPLAMPAVTPTQMKATIMNISASAPAGSKTKQEEKPAPARITKVNGSSYSNPKSTEAPAGGRDRLEHQGRQEAVDPIRASILSITAAPEKN